jgi:hypothetical protein
VQGIRADKYLAAIAALSVVFVILLFTQPRISDVYERAEFDAKVVKVDADKAAGTVYLQCKPENLQCLLDVPLLAVHPTHITGRNASVGDVVRVTALKVEGEWLIGGLRKL